MSNNPDYLVTEHCLGRHLARKAVLSPSPTDSAASVTLRGFENLIIRLSALLIRA